MSGRRLVIGFLAFVAVFAAALIYYQFFAYYERVEDVGVLEAGGVEIPVSDYEGIDASSSPLKLRGCFGVDPRAVAGLPEAEDATPLTPPPWFRCFDAGAIAGDLEAGAARAYVLARDTPEGFDRMIAVYPDGRGFLWRQLSERFE